MRHKKIPELGICVIFFTAYYYSSSFYLGWILYCESHTGTPGKLVKDIWPKLGQLDVTPKDFELGENNTNKKGQFRIHWPWHLAAVKGAAASRMWKGWNLDRHNGTCRGIQTRWFSRCDIDYDVICFPCILFSDFFSFPLIAQVCKLPDTFWISSFSA